VPGKEVVLAFPEGSSLPSELICKSLNVLIVEDSPDGAELLQLCLAHGGYQVSALRVTSRKEMEDALSSRDWDVVIADYAVPGFGAIAAIQVLKERKVDIPFIVVSGTINDDMAVSAMRAGAHDFVLKGNLNRLLPAIEREMREVISRRQKREMEAVLQLQGTAIQSVANSVVITDRVGTIQWVNTAFSKLTGYSPEEVLGRNPRLLSSGKHDTEFFQKMWNTILEGAVWQDELTNRRKDGTLYLERMTITPVTSNGAITHFVAIKEDVTERKRAEEALRESEERFRIQAEQMAQLAANAEEQRRRMDFALEAAGFGEWELDLVTHQTWRSHRHDQIFGYSSPLPEWTYELFLEHVLPEHRALVDRSFKEAVSAGDRWRVDTQIRRPDGTIRWIARRGRVVFDDAGKPSRMIGITMDITERKEAELALQRREQQMRAVLNALPVGVFICDATGTVVETNAAARAIWGAQVPLVKREDYGRFKGRLPGRDVWLTPSEWAMARALRSGESILNEEVEIETFDGSRKTILNNALPIWNEEGAIVGGVCVNVDITERKHTERALIRSEKLASVGRMAATIAHEINNPLAAAMNAVFLAGTEADMPDSARRHLQLAERELERVALITKQTLGFYRETNGLPSRVRVADVLDELLDLYGSKLKNQSIWVSRKYGATGDVHAVEGEIRQIVSNLVANSIDAMRQGGTLHLRTSGPLTIKGRPMIAVTVADTGEGIPAEHLKRIFEPFFTTKQSVGTGLGLWVTKELVSKNEGLIRIRSRIEKGTVTTVLFPKERRTEERRIA